MESIPGYDDWKTTPPDDPEPASVCDCCGKYLWEGEPIYLDINGENLCEVCLNKMCLIRYGYPVILSGKSAFTTIPDTEEAENKVKNSTEYHLQPTSQVREAD